MILPATAERTEGFCMPCKQGNRENIEASKEYYKKLKEYCPYRSLWEDIVTKAHGSTPLYANLSESELTYYAVESLYGEVFNGGFNQFFCNSSGDLYAKTLEGLSDIGDLRTLNILTSVKESMFGQDEVPVTQTTRTRLVIEYEEQFGYDIFDNADSAFDEYSDELTDLIEVYLNQTGLIKPYKKDNKAQ